ncbi:MAG: hypothetical protein V4450_07325 [Bacteroidota bacterium]
MLYLGIDPDLEKNGVAIWDSKARKIIELKCQDFFDTINTIVKVKRAGGTVIIEGGWLNAPGNFHKFAGSAAAGEKIAKNVGENHAIGKLLEAYCKKFNVPYLVVKPKKGNKTTNDLIFKNSGWEGRSNQEMRDAAGLVIGK